MSTLSSTVLVYKFYLLKKFLQKIAFCFIITFFVCNVFAQAQVKISGSVKDNQGEPLPGVSIHIKGQVKIGTTTDINGNFTLSVPSKNSVIVISSIGYITKEVAVGNQSNLSLTLLRSSSVLDDVVITGYTSTTRKDLTGSVATVDVNDLQKSPVRSFEEALGGRVSGVQVTSQDGKPGSPVNIYIRGIGSISQSSSPLYIIDGLAIENPDNNLIDPANIETITVLKDASSTAIYGARGSNGVIVITTKRGKPGAARIEYAGSYGINKPYKFMKLLSPYQFVQMLSEQLGAASNPYLVNGKVLEDYRNEKGTDWQDKLLQTGTQINQNLTLSGGNAGTLYSLSGNYFNQDGIILSSGYRRYQGKMTIDQKVGEKTKVGGLLSYTSGKITGTNPTANGPSSLFYSAYTYRPIPLPGINVVDFEESLYDPGNSYPADYRINPILSVKNEIRNTISNNLVGSIYINYNILKNLKLTLRGSINSNNSRYEIFNGSNTRSGGIYGSNGINGSILHYRTDIYDNTNLLEYSTTFNKIHRLNILAGASAQKADYQAYGYSATHIPDESLGLSGLDAGIIGTSPTAKLSSSTLLSGFGQANYIFNNKYYLTASFRADGSSKFPQNRWSYFPSAAVKWKLTEEKFLKSSTWLSDANIRFSYGAAGNNRVGDFDSYATINFTSPLYLFGNSQGNSAVTGSLANPNLKWETAVSQDLGFDLGFFKNRVTLTVELYKKVTKDLLYKAILPGNTGYSSSIKNIASISNRGLEITLGADIIKTKKLTYNTSFNITFNRNRLEALSDPSEEALTSTVAWEALYTGIPAFIAKIGGPLGQIYGLISDGLYQYSDFDKLPNGTYVLKGNIPTNGLAANRASTQPGDNKFVDINNDGQITPDDRTVIGNGYPLHVGGWSNNIRFKNFDINIFFQWSYGNDIINANRLWFSPGLGIQQRSSLFGGQNTFAEFANRWTPDNQNTDIPKLTRTTAGVYSSQYVEDGSYLRLKTFNIGYTLPSKVLTKLKISKVRVYLATSNLYTLTKYKGYDPEVSAFSTGLTPSLDYSTYPRPITITGGINITL
ncbi:MAG: TonB-dependent receptor [Bacteroidota bacterium]|nr:TonB-dependent receptor [Bacteroidota bacterium]